MTVSRRHAQLERTKDGWLITDLESTNGTRVNGWRVRGKVPVRAGDVVSFGNLETVFWARGGRPRAPRATAGRPPVPPPATAVGPSGPPLCRGRAVRQRRTAAAAGVRWPGDSLKS